MPVKLRHPSVPRITFARLARWALPALAAIGSPLAAQTYPSFRAEVGTQVTPANALAFYGSATARTGESTAPAEVTALALALGSASAAANPGAYVDRVYQYVRNTIEIELMFGSAKGGYGAMVDRSGTAFDQAELMVLLLRAGGITADYRVGDLTLPAADLANWFGVAQPNGSFDSSVLGQVLADGAIPYSSAGGSFTILHVWVAAIFGGQTYMFDPSRKTRTVTAGVNLDTATQFINGTASATFLSGSTAGSAGGVGTRRVLNAAGLETQLNTASGNLLTWIEANAPVSDVDELLGASRVIGDVVGSAGPRVTSLPNGVVQRSFTNIPDQYRKRLTVHMVDPGITVVGGGVVSKTFFDNRHFYLDRIYGRRLSIDTTDDLATFGLSLNGQGMTADWSQPGAPDFAQHAANRSLANLTLTINHPYAGAGGAYADRSVILNIDYVQPAEIVVGTGRFSGDLATRLTEVPVTERLVTPIASENNYPEGQHPFEHPFRVLADGPKLQLNTAWQSQVSRMVDLQSRIASAVAVEHHRIGLIYSSTQISYNRQPGVDQPVYAGTNETVQIGEDVMNISVDAAVSLRTRAVNASALTGLRHSIAAAAATLEGSVHEQISGLVDTSSTATRFEWANQTRDQSATCSPTSYGCEDKGQRRFAVATDAAQVAALQSGGMNVFQAFSPTPGASLQQLLVERYPSLNASLGPGVGSQFWVSHGTQGGILENWVRGTAVVAFRTDGTEVVHDVSNMWSGHKGGAGSPDSGQARQYDPRRAADILQDSFRDRSRDLGVDLSNGSFTHASGPDLIEGGGEFPVSLSFERSFSGAGNASHGLAPGWTHNWDYGATVAGSGLEAMGESSARAAAPSIAAFLAMQRAYAASTGLEGQLQGLLTANWWRKQLAFNLLTVRSGGGNRRFFRVARASGGHRWLADNGDLSSVAFTGSFEPGAIPIRGPLTRSLSRTYDFETYGITVTTENAVTMSFTPVGTPRTPAHLNPAGWFVNDQRPYASPSFIMPAMTLANGNVVTLTWESGPRVSRVQNAFGRRLDFAYAGGPTGMLIQPLLSVSAPNAGTATFTQSDFLGGDGRLDVVTLPESRFWSYTYTGQSRRPQIQFVFDPVEMAKPGAQRIPTVRVAYDANWRVNAIHDATASDPGSGRPAYQIFVADYFRGARQDPLGGLYQVLYDEERRPYRFIDELGRASTATYDSWGRVHIRTAPEGDQAIFGYDLSSNVTSLTRRAKPGSGLADMVTGAVYETTFGQPTSVTDAAGFTTNLSYVMSGAGRSELLQALRPAVNGVRPQYDYTYTALGQLQTARMRIDSIRWTTTRNYYDASGNLIRTVVDEGAGLVNQVTCFDYDAVGNRTGVTDGRSATCNP